MLGFGFRVKTRPHKKARQAEESLRMLKDRHKIVSEYLHGTLNLSRNPNYLYCYIGCAYLPTNQRASAAQL